jgi:hypothetical protein
MQEFRFFIFLTMPGVVELHYQVRCFLQQNPQVVPYDHVVEVGLYCGVVPYVVGLGVDTTSDYGQATLTWHQALYDVCRDICDTGRGHLPYHPFPGEQVVIENIEDGELPPWGVGEEGDIVIPAQEGQYPDQDVADPLQPDPDVKPVPPMGGNEYIEPVEEGVPLDLYDPQHSSGPSPNRSSAVDVEAEFESGVLVTVLKTDK